MSAGRGQSDVADVDLAAVQQHLAADVAAPGVAEHAHRELGATGAHQAGEPDDLARADLERDVRERDDLTLVLNYDKDDGVKRVRCAMSNQALHERVQGEDR